MLQSLFHGFAVVFCLFLLNIQTERDLHIPLRLCAELLPRHGRIFWLGGRPEKLFQLLEVIVITPKKACLEFEGRNCGNKVVEWIVRKGMGNGVEVNLDMAEEVALQEIQVFETLCQTSDYDHGTRRGFYVPL